MQPRNLTDVLHTRAADDDSPFLSMADFFSLISLTLIYISVVFAPASPLPEDAIPVVLGRVAEPGQAVAANSTYAYVTLQSFRDGVQILVAPRGKTTTARPLTLAMETTELGPASSWIEGELLSAEIPERVIMRIQAGEQKSDVHRLFNALVADIRQRFPVSIVIVDQ